MKKIRKKMKKNSTGISVLKLAEREERKKVIVYILKTVGKKGKELEGKAPEKSGGVGTHTTIPGNSVKCFW